MCKLVKKIDVASIQNRNLNVNLFQLRFDYLNQAKIKLIFFVGSV